MPLLERPRVCGRESSHSPPLLSSLATRQTHKDKDVARPARERPATKLGEHTHARKVDIAEAAAATTTTTAAFALVLAAVVVQPKSTKARPSKALCCKNVSSRALSTLNPIYYQTELTLRAPACPSSAESTSAIRVLLAGLCKHIAL